VRELVRQVQELRKSRGLDVADHVELWLDGITLNDDERGLLAREVLADAVHHGSVPGERARVELDEALEVEVGLAAVGAPG
jgi:hypothetical protein